MRQIEQTIIQTVKNMKSFEYFSNCEKSLSIRDSVEKVNNEINVRLWGHKIFSFDMEKKTISFCFCDYPTNTTKSRINSLLDSTPCYIKQKNYKLYLVNRSNKTETKINSWDTFTISNQGELITE